MKSYALRKIALISLFGLITSGLSACSVEQEKHCKVVSNASASNPPAQIAAVVAPTSNFVDFESIITAAESDIKNDLGANLSKQEMKHAIGRELSIVVADGVPQLASKRIVKVTSTSPSDYDIRVKAIKAAFNSFGLISRCAAGKLKKSTDFIPTEEESDLLAALGIAADQFSASVPVKKLYILGNGIQTSGQIRMQDKGQFPTSEKLADQLAVGLRDIGALPDLKGTSVYWYGLGQVDGTQQKLDQKSTDSLIHFWKKVIEFSNGNLVDTNIRGKVGTGLPHANAIHTSQIDIKPCGIVVTLHESDGVKFKPDSSSFVDLNSATAKAKEVVNEFKAANCDTITVHGYAAAGVDKSEYESKKLDIDQTNQALTTLRAKAFAKLLKSAGFTGEISTDGAGTCEDEQWTSSGKKDESLQQLCRRVEVTN